MARDYANVGCASAKIKQSCTIDLCILSGPVAGSQAAKCASEAALRGSCNRESAVSKRHRALQVRFLKTGTNLDSVSKVNPVMGSLGAAMPRTLVTSPALAGMISAQLYC